MNRMVMEADTNRLAVSMILWVDHRMRMVYGNRIHRRLLVVRPGRLRLKQQLPADGQRKKITKSAIQDINQQSISAVF